MHDQKKTIKWNHRKNKQQGFKIRKKEKKLKRIYQKCKCYDKLTIFYDFCL